jgi:hypothetical protein
VQICRISVPEHADVPGLLRAIEGFLAAQVRVTVGPCALITRARTAVAL